MPIGFGVGVGNIRFYSTQHDDVSASLLVHKKRIPKEEEEEDTWRAGGLRLDIHDWIEDTLRY